MKSAPASLSMPATRIGLLGKEGGSGGWSALHFDVFCRMPSGSGAARRPMPWFGRRTRGSMVRS